MAASRKSATTKAAPARPAAKADDGKPNAVKPNNAPDPAKAPAGQVSAPAEHDGTSRKDLVTEPPPPVTEVNAGDPDHRLETPQPPTADHQATIADDIDLVQQPKTVGDAEFQRPADSAQVVVKTDPPPPEPNQNAAVNGLVTDQPGVQLDAQNEARREYLKTGTPPVMDPDAGVGHDAGHKGSSAEDGTPGVEQPVGR